jgi:hypothetical protein
VALFFSQRGGFRRLAVFELICRVLTFIPQAVFSELTPAAKPSKLSTMPWLSVRKYGVTGSGGKQSRMMLVHDDIYEWEGWGGRLRLASGKCRLRIFDLTRGPQAGLSHLRPIIVIVSDVEGSRMSVRSCTGHIATQVSRDFHIDPHRMVYIEYYPRTVYGDQGQHLIAEKYEVVDFTWTEGGAIQPRWRSLKSPLLDTIRNMVAGAS